MIPFTKNQKIIEIGGGNNPQFRPNLDIRSGPTVDIIADLNKKFPLDDCSYDGVYSAYLLEHISWRKVKEFIREVNRILKPGGIAFLITANLQQQCKVLATKQDWTESDICMLFGDQNYDDMWQANAHYCGFSPKSAIEIFTNEGFVDILVRPHPNCETDMIIIAKKSKGETMTTDPKNWTSADRKLAYNREYFDGGRGKFGGYANEGYWDYPVHWNVVQKIMEFKPTSILELGSARGYIIKKLSDMGIKSLGLEISDHCIQTKVTEDIKQWDITKTPWPIKSKSFDLCFSIAVLEHIPADKLPKIMSEIKRTCKRSLHGVSFADDNFDKTHVTLQPIEWWKSKFRGLDMIVDKEELVKGSNTYPQSDGKIKLNIGSFTTMFHYGWTNIDIHALDAFAAHYGYNFKQIDARNGLPYDNDSVDYIYMCHFLEHLNYDDGLKVLKECTRVMKKSGVIRIIMPDAKLLIQNYMNGKMDMYDELNDGCANTKSQISKLWMLLFSGHSSIYDFETTSGLLKSVGLTPRQCKFRTGTKQILIETLDMFPTLSMYVEGTKV